MTCSSGYLLYTINRAQFSELTAILREIVTSYSSHNWPHWSLYNEGFFLHTSASINGSLSIGHLWSFLLQKKVKKLYHCHQGKHKIIQYYISFWKVIKPLAISQLIITITKFSNLIGYHHMLDSLRFMSFLFDSFVTMSFCGRCHFNGLLLPPISTFFPQILLL